jgi:hypothetical protein
LPDFLEQLAMFRLLPGIILVLTGFLSSIAGAQEIEPNHPCESAQVFGLTELPFSLFGALTPTDASADVDFFRFALTPGESVQADLEGASTGQGTLGDPFLGLFDSACNLVAVNDDSGSLNSRLSFAVPADGIVILGVTACCDGGFEGGGEGSYLLSLSRLAAIDSIFGRIIDGDTGAPLTGQDFPFASVQLQRCDDFGCFEFVGFQQADGDGLFEFTSDQFGNVLPADTYQVQASAAGFDTLTSGPFEVGDGEALDLGDLGLSRIQLIGTVSGRLVDAVSGDPVSGFIPPFAVVFLERCESGTCFAVAGASPDLDGRFSFNGAAFSISPGSFRLRGYADDYSERVSAEFAVAAFENLEFGDFHLTPFPIQFGAVQECQIPPGGGLCEFSITASNRGPGRYRGEAWANVEVFTPGASRSTRFQVGNTGPNNPMPRRINLKRGASTTLEFRLDTPATVLEGSVVCVAITVGRDPDPQFNTQGDRFISCAVKNAGAFEALPKKAIRQRYRDQAGRSRRTGH